MKLSLKWLQFYIDLSDVDIVKLSNKITMSICEIEKIYKVFQIPETIVVGKVLECKPHPDSSVLSVCNVDVGKEILQIVCGASNVKKDSYVAVAKIGTELNINNNVIKIEKRIIKKIESFGMICSSKELGIHPIIGETDGILLLNDLDEEVFQYAEEKTNQKKENLLKVGTQIKEVFPYEDTIIEIDNKSITNRPDLWSHFGFALELSAILDKKIKYNPLTKIKKFNTDPKLPKKQIIIKNNSALAYNGIVCINVNIKKSPLWLRILLSAIDQKCINNVVDISNYVMYEIGQPNHAFDLRDLKSNNVICDLTKTEIQWKALDQNEYTIPPNSIMIYDKETPVALGGIIGGANSAIKEDTTEIFIESATFPRSFIRKTISATGIRTESSRRFEKGLDPARSKIAIYRFIELLKQSNPKLKVGSLSSKFTTLEKRENQIKTSLDFIQKKLGFPIQEKQVKNILNKLNFKVSIQKNKSIIVTVPSYRSYYDITIPEDLVEEIGRIYGYDNIQPVAPKVEIQKPILPFKRYFERQWKTLLSSIGRFYETMNYSFSTLEDNELFGHSGIELLNPAQKHKNRMRVSLIPGLLEQVYINIHRTEEFGLYELGKIFIPKENQQLPDEYLKLTIAYTSEVKKYNTFLFPSDSPNIEFLFLVRDAIEKILNFFQISFDIQIPKTSYPFLHPKCQMEWLVNKEKIGFIGLLHPFLYKKYDYPEEKIIVLADLEFDLIYTIWNEKRSKKESHYKPPSTAPKSTFDFTLLLPKNEFTYRPVEIINHLYPEFINIQLVDIYEGPSIPKDKKSVTYRVHCLDKEPIPNEKLQKMLDNVVQILERNGFQLKV